jgi:DNA-directed RNA polymerase subunit alpha
MPAKGDSPYSTKFASPDIDHDLDTSSMMKKYKKEERENVVDEETLQLRKILGTPLEDLELSVRAFNCLKAAKINSLSELVNYTQDELMKFRNFGQKSLSEIEQVLHERGLHFGMDISRLKSLSKDF